MRAGGPRERKQTGGAPRQPGSPPGEGFGAAAQGGGAGAELAVLLSRGDGAGVMGGPLWREAVQRSAGAETAAHRERRDPGGPSKAPLSLQLNTDQCHSTQC